MFRCKPVPTVCGAPNPSWRWPEGRVIAATFCGLGFLAIGACMESPETAAPRNVFVISESRLTGPEVGRSSARAPTTWEMVATNNGDIRIADFELTVATDAPDQLRARLTSFNDDRAAVNLILFDSEMAGDKVSDVIASDQRCLDRGCFVVLGDGGGESTLSRRVRFLIPDSLLAGTPYLELFVSTSGMGDPVLADRVQLTGEFFYMAAIGDSIMWGNGLRDRQKFSTITAETIERERGIKVVSMVYAVSGARIVPPDPITICEGNCFGEAPTGVTPIILQVDQIESPEALDLVLLDGCANDVGLSAIMSPLTDPADLTSNTVQFCETEMIGLLRKTRSVAPNAPIVVTGYFEFVSSESLEFGAEELAIIQGVARDDLEGIEDPLMSLVVNSVVFDTTSRASLNLAVETVNNDRSNDPPIVFADPAFTDDNAVFASRSFVWNLVQNDELRNTLGFDLRLFPEDPLLDIRVDRCFAPEVIPDVVSCVYASLAHPNPAGARAYADAVIASLQDISVLSP